MNAQEIKTAVDNGQTVNWKSPAYIVIKDSKNQYMIKCTSNNHCIGLTWADETTLNGKEEDFTIAPAAIEEEKNVIVQLPFKGNIMTCLKDGKPQYTNYASFEEYKAAREEEGKEIVLMSWSEFNAMYNSFWESDFTEITEEQYNRAWGELPPLKSKWLTDTIHSYFCSEAMSGQYHSCYIFDKANNKFYCGLKSQFLSNEELLQKFNDSLTKLTNITEKTQSDGTPTRLYITQQEAIEKLGATFSRMSDFSNPIYKIMGKEYIMVDDVMHTMTPDWEEPNYPVRKTTLEFASFFNN